MEEERFESSMSLLDVTNIRRCQLVEILRVYLDRTYFAKTEN